MLAFGDASEINRTWITIIDGQQYTGQQILDMSEAERLKLADAWVEQEIARVGLTPSVTGPDQLAGLRGQNVFDLYRDERQAFIDAHPELKGFKAFQKAAGDYEGGERAFRQYLERVSPNYARAIGEERERLERKGFTGEALEAKLDRWAFSAASYDAYRGVKHKQGDPEPLDTFDEGETLPPITTRGKAADTTADTGATTPASTAKDDNDGWDEARGMPDWQVRLEAEWRDYQAVIAELEAELGPLDAHTNPFFQDIVQDRLPEVSRDLRTYLNWSEREVAEGRDGSIEAYFRFKNEQYESRKPDDEAA